jgi:hypothetical protein
MDDTAKMEQARGQGKSLEQIAQQFKRWRAARTRGQHIPAVLWAAAVRMAGQHGLQRVAGVLRVDQDRLQRRLEHAGGAAPAATVDTRFVELLVTPASAAASRCECSIELENARGAKLRVELNGNGLAGLAGLCNAFWSAA